MDFNVVECLPALLRHARTLEPDAERAEELVARALSWAIEHTSQFDPKFGLENWLIFITDMVACEVLDRPRKLA